MVAAGGVGRGRLGAGRVGCADGRPMRRAPSPTLFRVPGPTIDEWFASARRAREDRDRWHAMADQLAHALDNIGDCDCDLLAPEHDADCHIGLALVAYTELQAVVERQRAGVHSGDGGPS